MAKLSMCIKQIQFTYNERKYYGKKSHSNDAIIQIIIVRLLILILIINSKTCFHLQFANNDVTLVGNLHFEIN